jgi:hypothetical protein
MTLPDERYRAVVQTRRFLLDLCNPEHTPRVPKLVRQTARDLLRHYPSDWDMKQVARDCEGDCPKVFAEQMEPLYRMVKQYDMEKKEQNENRT